MAPKIPQAAVTNPMTPAMTAHFSAPRFDSIVVVQDTTDCEIGFETDYNMHECCEDTDIIDYGEYSSNLPCSDEPEITNSYTFNACQTTSYQQEVSYWANDGEVESYTKIPADRIIRIVQIEQFESSN